MPRPILLGIVGDSGSGKTTLTRGLVRVLGEGQVTHVSADHYHRYDRRQRAERDITPAASRLQPPRRPRPAPRAPAERRADHEARLPAHRRHLRPARLRAPGAFTSPRGCSASTPRSCATASTCASTSTRPRSCAAAGRCSATARGAATRPTRCSRSSTGARPTPRLHPPAAPPRRHRRRLPARRTAGPGAPRLQARAARHAHPPRPHRRRRRRRRTGSADRAARAPSSSTSRARSRPSARPRSRRRSGRRCTSPSHLRDERLGEFTIGTDLHRSDALAVAQLLSSTTS